MGTSELNPTEYSGRDLVGYGPSPPNPNWPAGAKIAINLVLNYEEGSESSPLNGDPVSESMGSELGPGLTSLQGERNITVESLYEYGSRAGVWRILRLLEEYGVKCTSYAIGQALLQNPKVSEALEAGGHEIASHGWRWVDRGDWSVEEEVANVRKAIEAIKSTAPSGKAPVGWYYGRARAKAASRSRALLAQVFREENLPLKYYSDDYSDDLPHWVPSPGGRKDEGLLIIPYTMDTNDARNFGHHAFTTPDDFSSYLIAAFDELYAEGVKGSPKMLSVGLHARTVGRPARIAGLRKFIEHAKSKPDVWFATREEIADHWVKQFPYKP